MVRLRLPSKLNWIALLPIVGLLSNEEARANAPPGRYTYPQAGVVFDTKTKLTWQQSVDPGPYDLNAALAYCAALPLGGGSWRVPTVKELLTIVDATLIGTPTIDPVAFPNTPARYFWSSTSAGSTYNWSVNFAVGNIKVIDATLVRCVR